eukprot:224305-Rhodomonas_salina.5
MVEDGAASRWEQRTGGEEGALMERVRGVLDGYRLLPPLLSSRARTEAVAQRNQAQATRFSTPVFWGEGVLL